ncbi:MAG: hypothetical protein L0H54_11420 [Alcaligenaceae bacterium]|nr:hypothetical protein [Alcaligenaceae bacterium]
MTRKLWRPVSLSAVAMASLPMLASAAGTATIEGKSMSDGPITIMWQDDGALRINPDPNAPENYMIVRDGKVYNVSRGDGKPMVMEVGGMLKAFGAMAADSQKGEQAIPAGIESVEATGKSETVAGIEGHVYKVTTVNADGTKKTGEVVLSSDPRATEMTEMYMTTMLSIFAQSDPQAILDALPDDERGMLRYDQDYYLTSISGDAPAADQFKLPAKPTNLADMLKNLQLGK